MLQMIWISRRCIYTTLRGIHAHVTHTKVQPTGTVATSAAQSADARARRNLHSSIQAQPTAPRLRVPKSTAACRAWRPFFRPARRTPDFHGGHAHLCIPVLRYTHLWAYPAWRTCSASFDTSRHALMHAEVVNGYTLTWLMWSGPSSIWPARMQVSPLVSYSNDTVHNSVHHQFPSNATYDSISTMPSW